jgi:replicative DNA helicase
MAHRVCTPMAAVALAALFFSLVTAIQVDHDSMLTGLANMASDAPVFITDAAGEQRRASVSSLRRMLQQTQVRRYVCTGCC